MRAYVYHPDGSARFEERPAPKATSDSAVIAVRMTAICGTDLRARRHVSKSIVAPRVIGHEVVGEIVDVGSGASGFAVGDRVQVAPAIGCGRCRPCGMGHTNLCDNLQTIGFQFDGSFAEYMQIPAAALQAGNVTKVHQELPDDLAVLAEPVACILNSHRFLNLDNAASVAVFGSGFIGCMHAEIALKQGVKTVFILEIDAARRSSAAETIPEAVIMDPNDPRTQESVSSMTDAAGVDVAIVACSAGPAQAQAMNMTAKMGRVSLFGGLPAQSIGYVDSNLIHYREISVHGVHASTPQQNREALSLLQAGSLRTQPYRENVFPLARIEEAFEALEDGTALKVLLRPGQ